MIVRFGLPVAFPVDVSSELSFSVCVGRKFVLNSAAAIGRLVLVVPRQWDAKQDRLLTVIPDQSQVVKKKRWTLK